jgi:hypothetical protein
MAHDFTCRDAAFVRYWRNSEHAAPGRAPGHRSKRGPPKARRTPAPDRGTSLSTPASAAGRAGRRDAADDRLLFRGVVPRADDGGDRRVDRDVDGVGRQGEAGEERLGRDVFGHAASIARIAVTTGI